MKNVQRFLAAGEAAADEAQQQAEEEADQTEERFFERVEALKEMIESNSEWLFDWMQEPLFGKKRYEVQDPYFREKEWGKALLSVATAKTTGDAIAACRQMQAVIDQAAAWRAEEILRASK